MSWAPTRAGRHNSCGRASANAAWVMSSAARSSDVGVEIGRHRHRAERHQFAPRQEDPAEERVRHRHQRQHVDLSRHVIADPLLGVRIRAATPPASR